MFKIFTAAALAVCALHASAQQGVSDNELVLGTIQDLSGPVASVSRQIRAGMQMRVDEINEQGGIHGRKVSLLVEDSGYDPRRAALAAQKLVNRDGIFAMVGHGGTAQNMAAMPIQFEKNVMNFFPISGAREMYEPPSHLKFAYMPSYDGQTRDAVVKLVGDNSFERVCTMYQDDEAGLEVLRGAEAGLKALGMDFVERTSFKRGATDFSTQMLRLKAAKCDFVVMATIIRETIGGVNAARRLDFHPTFLLPQPAYNELIPKLGGPAMNGLYAPMTFQIPYLDDPSGAIRAWAEEYQTKFNEEPGVSSATGYMIVDAFIQTATKAGRNLTPESFNNAMESNGLPTDIFGSPLMSFSPTERLGSYRIRLSRIQEGKWEVVSDYLGD